MHFMKISAFLQLLVCSSAVAAPLKDAGLQKYFEGEVARIEAKSFEGIKSRDDWERERPRLVRELREMLGLEPMPPSGDLKAVVTGTVEREGIVVEKVHFQSSPGLYVTGNLYRPAKVEGRLPAVLYVCGHGPVKTNGVSYGNKVAYQHHGAWFARNGYVCLTIDTIQLGEIEGVHHGTYREGMWWWNSRGYSPAGVEAWFGIRALDYLCSRPEVDKERIGMTGRSGGGSYTWTVAALDERVKVAAPVAGITDLQNQVVDGVVEGHCDCMFFVNTYRWDFPLVAALIAPRPLLIGNSDKDTIFPLDGVVRVYNQARRIYQLYGQTNRLGLLITDGPHADTQDLQLPVFRWFNRFLKGEDPTIEMAAKRLFEPEQLRALDQNPTDQINTRIQETFVPRAQPRNRRSDLNADELVKQLRAKVFGGWPVEPCRVLPELMAQSNQGGLRSRVYKFASQPDVDLSMVLFVDSKIRKPEQIILKVLDAQSWANSPCDLIQRTGLNGDQVTALRQQLQQTKSAQVFFAPRLVQPTPWSTDPKKLIQIRRRFMLLGQTLEGMRVWDIRCAIQALKSLPEFNKLPTCIQAEGAMGVNAVYAALFEPEAKRLELTRLPKSHDQGPDYLNVLKYTDIPEVLGLLGDRVQVR